MLQYKIIPVTAFQQNTSIIWCDKTQQAAMVDPGGEAEKLIAAVTELGVNLVKVLLTHGHLDHVGATHAIAEHYAIPIIGPQKEELFWLEKLPQQSEMFGLQLSGAVEPDQWLEQGDTVALGESVLQVRFCPGHTPGHVIFYDDEAKLAIVGDVLFDGSIGRTDFPRGNHQQLLQSIQSQLLSLEDEVVFIPGHGPTSTIGKQRVSNPFLQDL